MLMAITFYLLYSSRLRSSVSMLLLLYSFVRNAFCEGPPRPVFFYGDGVGDDKKRKKNPRQERLQKQRKPSKKDPPHKWKPKHSVYSTVHSDRSSSS
ncbi:hypothetical protein GQ457_15G009830 [Hibiscus cannabinus]